MTGRGQLAVTFYSDAQELGGAELSLGYLLGALSPRVSATVVGTSPHVVGRLAATRDDARAVVLSPIRNVRDLAAMREHVRAFRHARPDVIHVNLNTSGGSPWAIVAGRVATGARVIAVEHLPHPIRRARRRWLTKLTARLLAAHVAVGKRAARDVASFTGVAPGSVTTIRNGVPDVNLEPLPRSPGMVVGSLGRLEPQKAYDVLVRALQELPGATAVVVGEGSERSRLEELARSVGVDGRLELPGWGDDARHRLTTFDVFVLPSRWEGLPLVVLEAMLAGLPVVASDVGSVSEAVVDGATGLLVPPGDAPALAAALGRLLDDADLRKAMGERGRARAIELFGADAMAAQYEALYARVLS